MNVRTRWRSAGPKEALAQSRGERLRSVLTWAWGYGNRSYPTLAEVPDSEDVLLAIFLDTGTFEGLGEEISSLPSSVQERVVLVNSGFGLPRGPGEIEEVAACLPNLLGIDFKFALDDEPWGVEWMSSIPDGLDFLGLPTWLFESTGAAVERLRAKQGPYRLSVTMGGHSYPGPGFYEYVASARDMRIVCLSTHFERPDLERLFSSDEMERVDLYLRDEEEAETLLGFVPRKWRNIVLNLSSGVSPETKARLERIDWVADLRCAWKR